LRDGVIEQIGDPRTVYRAPASRFVADFIGESNWLEAKLESASNGEIILKTDGGQFRAPAASLNGAQTGQSVWLGFRPEAVQMGAGDANSFATTITHVSYLGEIEQYGLELAPSVVVKAFEQNPLEIRQPGEKLNVHVRPQDLLVLRKDS